jgi:hypothetical protein
MRIVRTRAGFELRLGTEGRATTGSERRAAAAGQPPPPPPAAAAAAAHQRGNSHHSLLGAASAAVLAASSLNAHAERQLLAHFFTGEQVPTDPRIILLLPLL